MKIITTKHTRFNSPLSLPILGKVKVDENGIVEIEESKKELVKDFLKLKGTDFQLLSEDVIDDIIEGDKNSLKEDLKKHDIKDLIKVIEEEIVNEDNKEEYKEIKKGIDLRKKDNSDKIDDLIEFFLKYSK